MQRGYRGPPVLGHVFGKRRILPGLLREESNEAARIFGLEDGRERDEALRCRERAHGLDLFPWHRLGKSIHQIDIDEPVVGAEIEVIGAKKRVGRVVMVQGGSRLYA